MTTRTRGLFTHFHHNWSSFLPNMRWRDFCLIHVGGEWNPSFGRVEWTVALLGLWYTGTYVYDDQTPDVQRLRDMLTELEKDREERDFSVGGTA